MKLRDRIILNAGSTWMSMIVTAFVGIALVPIMLSKVGMTGYGVWALLTQSLAYLSILDRAFSLAVNRYVAFYQDRPEDMNRFVSASFLILAALSLVTVGVAFLVSFFLTGIFSAIPSSLAFDAQITCILVGVTLAMRILEANFSGTLQGFQLYMSTNVIAILCSILRLVLTIIALFIMKSIIAIQASFALCSAVSAILVYWCARRQTEIRISLRNVDRQAMRLLWKFTMHSIARYGSAVVMFNTMTLLLGIFGTAANVAVYSIACMIPNFIRGLLASSQNVFLPSISTLFAKGEIEKIKLILKRATEISAVITFAFCLTLLAFTGEILRFWLKDAATEETRKVTQMLILSAIPGGLFEIWLPVLVAMGYLRGLTVRSIATAVFAIVLEVVLLQGYVSKPMAPALALTVTAVLSTAIWLTSYGLGRLKMSFADYFQKALAKPIIACVLAVFAIAVVREIGFKIQVHWMTTFLLTGIISAFIFIMFSLRKEFSEFARLIRKRIGI